MSHQLNHQSIPNFSKKVFIIKFFNQWKRFILFYEMDINNTNI